MTNVPKRRWRGPAAAAFFLLPLLLGWGAAGAQNHRHPDPQAMGSEFQILEVLEAPTRAPGHLAYDPESGRLWMITHGPPANASGPSTLYEIDAEDGTTLDTAQLPFLGEIGMVAFVDGSLYQVVHHQSKMYKISVERESFGQVLAEIALPTLNQIEHEEEAPLRFPFISFKGVALTAEGDLLAHAQDLGELMVLDPETGRLRSRVATMRALGGIAATRGDRGESLVLGNSDPVKAGFEYHVRRYMFRASHGVVPATRYGKKAIHWVLLDGESGELLASIRRLDPRIDASSVALISRERVEGAPYGRLEFWATGAEGIFRAQWTPGMRSREAATERNGG